MRLLLDTHIFLWYISGDAKLPAAFRAAIQDPANAVYLSVASVWEAVIKYGLGKQLARSAGGVSASPAGVARHRHSPP
jgi:PIN domain nuclease of toxin-antitoxin system